MANLMTVKEGSATRLVDYFQAAEQLPPNFAAALEDTGLDIDLDLVVDLGKRASTLFGPDNMDPWLAPRLHAALRIPRRIAADRGMWTWLALLCHNYIEARFRKKKKRVHPWRYRGEWHRNGISRLWWGAEMTRNGPDYIDVETCFGRTRTAEFALELMYSWNRPAAVAFARVAEGKDGGVRLPDRQVNALRLSSVSKPRSVAGNTTKEPPRKSVNNTSAASTTPLSTSGENGSREYSATSHTTQPGTSGPIRHGASGNVSPSVS